MMPELPILDSHQRFQQDWRDIVGRGPESPHSARRRKQRDTFALAVDDLRAGRGEAIQIRWERAVEGERGANHRQHCTCHPEDDRTHRHGDHYSAARTLIRAAAWRAKTPGRYMSLKSAPGSSNEPGVTARKRTATRKAGAPDSSATTAE